VQVEGGLLAVGDVHARQGDGEVCGQGIEIAAEVRLRPVVNPPLPLPRVVVETEEHVALLAHGDSLDEAAQRAIADGARFVARCLGVSGARAMQLLSTVCDLRISQVVNPQKTVRVCIPKALVPRLFEQ